MYQGYSAAFLSVFQLTVEDGQQDLDRAAEFGEELSELRIVDADDVNACGARGDDAVAGVLYRDRA